MIQKLSLSNPFVGLRPFESEDAYLFFGRESLIDQLIFRLEEKKLLPIIGTSGSGKSSLVRAGLLSSLAGGLLNRSRWRVAIMRPGNSPIQNLIDALVDPEIFGTESEDQFILRAFTESTLRKGELGLVETVRLGQMAENEKFLLVIDQFEEIFRFLDVYRVAQAEDSDSDNSLNESYLIKAKDEAAAFVKLFLSSINQTEIPVYVILTMRAEFWGECTQFRNLPEALNDSQYLIPRLTRDQLRKAIEGPIAVTGGKIRNSLVNQLLNEVGDDPDQLPILQHAMMRAWDHWHNTQDEEINIKHYDAVGGMSQALSKHADELFEGKAENKDGIQQSADRSREQLILKGIFDTLTEVNKDRQLIRRPTSICKIRENIDQERINRINYEEEKLKEYSSSSFKVPTYLINEISSQEIIAQINVFRGPGKSFLVPARGSVDEETILDISHESIIRKWKRLGDWKREETIQILRKEIVGDSSIALLNSVWERQRAYSQNATNAQEQFFTLERIITFLAVAVVVLAVAQPIVLYRLIPTPALYEQRLPFDLLLNPPRHRLLGSINLLLVFLPITITALRAFAIKFSQGNGWVLLRGSAEALKTEVFYFRTRVKHYRTNRNAELANRIQLISKRLEGSAVQQRALYPYENQPQTRVRMGILLRLGRAISIWFNRLIESCLEFLVGIREEVAEKTDTATQGRDDRLSDLDPEGYIQYRLDNQFDWYRRKARIYDRQHQILQTSAYIFGGFGTLLAAIGFQAWVAVTAALAAALIGYLEYRRVEATVMGYTQAADVLYDIRTWWFSLPETEKADFVNFEKLVVNTEETIRSENSSWLQDMQDRLENLYENVNDEKETYPDEAKAFAPDTPSDQNFQQSPPRSIEISNIEEEGSVAENK